MPTPIGNWSTSASTGMCLRTTGTPFLVSYDFDARRPTATGVVLQNLTQVHAREIVANHVLFAIDACHAGSAGAQRPWGRTGRGLRKTVSHFERHQSCR